MLYISIFSFNLWIHVSVCNLIIILKKKIVLNIFKVQNNYRIREVVSPWHFFPPEKNCEFLILKFKTHLSEIRSIQVIVCINCIFFMHLYIKNRSGPKKKKLFHVIDPKNTVFCNDLATIHKNHSLDVLVCIVLHKRWQTFSLCLEVYYSIIMYVVPWCVALSLLRSNWIYLTTKTESKRTVTEHLLELYQTNKWLFEKALSLRRQGWRIWGRGKRCIWRWGMWEGELEQWDC